MIPSDSPYPPSKSSFKSAVGARTEHTRQQAEHLKNSSEQSKRDTEHYLQYYQSSLADGRTDESDEDPSCSSSLTRQTSTGSTSSSDYSDSQTTNVSMTAPKARRRSKAPSNGGSDRRRLAIVQMDSLDDPPPGKSLDRHSQSGSLRSRRGLPASLLGLALVAPPDAAPKSYSHLTPPITAMAPNDTVLRETTRGDYKGHARSLEGTNASNTPSLIATVDSVTPVSETLNATHIVAQVEGLMPRNDGFRQSASPSPSDISGKSDQAHGLLSPMYNTQTENHPLIVTPEIGETKEIGARVAAPVVISLSSAGPFRRKDSSKPKDNSNTPAIAQPPSSQDKSFLNYQPGVHATAGPLPPPPRAMFNIDTNSPAPPRPPRLNSPNHTRSRGDIEAVKQALQLPSSVTAALASRSSRPNPTKHTEFPETSTTAALKGSGETAKSTNDMELHQVKLGHKREGAFPPSTSTSTTSDSEAAASPVVSQTSPKIIDSLHDDTTAFDSTKSTSNISANHSDVPPITVSHAMTPIDEQKEHPIQNEKHDMISSPSTKRRMSDETSLVNGSPSRSPPSIGHQTPSPPPKSFRNSLTTNLKRLSSTLPRTPSLSSKSRRSSGTYYTSRTPSPSIHMVHSPPTRSKIISQYPPAMFFAEITARKTSLERSALYAQKINELYMYDSGLGDWTVETKLRVNNNRPSGPTSSHIFTPQPRHTSRASMISEATFPRRADASTATDLSIKTHDLTPAAPPVLPYPSLANQRAQPTRSSSVASGTPPASLRSLAPSTPTSKSSGGFFASLGRKTSMSSARKEKPGPLTTSASASPARLTKSPPASATPRSINISSIPSVPGGPRAAPGRRAMRSQTILTSTNPFASNAASFERNEELMRRPSLADLNTEAVIDISADPEFVRQVDKLVDLLPNADRGVLAGYLRRAGQDILAIGQFLEDEKNGTIKAP